MCRSRTPVLNHSIRPPAALESGKLKPSVAVESSPRCLVRCGVRNLPARRASTTSSTPATRLTAFAPRVAGRQPGPESGVATFPRLQTQGVEDLDHEDLSGAVPAGLLQPRDRLQQRVDRRVAADDLDA